MKEVSQAEKFILNTPLLADELFNESEIGCTNEEVKEIIQNHHYSMMTKEGYRRLFPKLEEPIESKTIMSAGQAGNRNQSVKSTKYSTKMKKLVKKDPIAYNLFRLLGKRLSRINSSKKTKKPVWEVVMEE